MNQHYVPEFYLKKFSLNDKQIFVYDKVLKRSFSSSISSIASQQSFYEHSNKESMEDDIGKLEAVAGSTFKGLIESLSNNQFTKISSAQKENLIVFIWLQMNRTLESRIHFGSMVPYLFSKLSDTPFDLDVKMMLAQNEVSDNHIEFLKTAKEDSFALEMLGNRNFIIVKNETEVDFLTSDEPVVRHLHWESDHRIYEIFLPITPRFGLWMVPKNIFEELDKADRTVYTFTEDQNILFYNFHQIYQSTRQIFSRTGNFDYLHEIFKQDPNFGNLNKKRIE